MCVHRSSLYICPVIDLCPGMPCPALCQLRLDGKHTPSSLLEVCLLKGIQISFVFFKFQNNNDIKSASNTTGAVTDWNKASWVNHTCTAWLFAFNDQFKMMTHTFSSSQGVGGVY